MPDKNLHEGDICGVSSHRVMAGKENRTNGNYDRTCGCRRWQHDHLASVTISSG